VKKRGESKRRRLMEERMREKRRRLMEERR